MKDHLVTIIIVTYNAELHLKNCLENIRKQNCRNLQLIVIDGASTDNTINIIISFDDIIDFWLSEPDKGIYDAMNKGLNYVKGDWVIFLGADDILETGFKDMLKELANPNAIYYGMVDVNNIIYKDPYTSYRLSKLNICHQAIFYPTKVFKKYKYNLHYPIWADWFLNIQCWADNDYQFIYKENLISRFGLEGISSTVTDHNFKRDKYKIVLKYLGLFVLIRLMVRHLKNRTED
jgi:glycosyltransferase involved in cell wall biosynthesis